MPKKRQIQDLPLKRTFNGANINANPLQVYISSSRIPTYDLPRQISKNPYAQQSSSFANFYLQSRPHENFSKCVATDISKHADSQQSETLTTICHKLFSSDSYFQKDGGLQKTSNQQIITQATFKPIDLKKYLAHSGNSPNRKIQADLKRQGDHKRHLSLNLKPQPNRRPVSGKTKYQILLDQHFNQKIKEHFEQPKIMINKQRKDQQLNHQQVPIKLRLQSQTHRYDQVLSNLQQEAKRSKINKSKSQKIFIPKKSPASTNVIDKPTIKRNHSQYKIRQATDKDKNINLEEKNNWMQLTFSERQARVLENRREKQNIGLKINIEKQVKNCTFKPILTVFKPLILQNTPTSYAKMYYQKIRRKK